MHAWRVASVCMARAWRVHGVCMGMGMRVRRCAWACAWRVHGTCMACAHEHAAAIGAPGRVGRDERAEQAVLCCGQLVGGTEEARGELTDEDIAPRLVRGRD